MNSILSAFVALTAQQKMPSVRNGSRSVWFLACLIHTVALAWWFADALAVLNRLNGFH